MNILFCVSNSNLNSSGGMNKVLSYSLNEFERQGINYKVVTAKSFIHLLSGILKVILSNPFKFDYIVFNSLAAVRFDLNRYWIFYYLLAHLFNWEKVIYWHEMSKYFENYSNTHKMSAKLISMCFNRQSVLNLAVSKSNSGIVADFFNKGKLKIVFNTVDVEPILGNNRFINPTVLTVASIQKLKGVDIWTDVAIEVCKLNKAAYFIWCGTGDSNLKRECQEKISQNNLQDRIQFIGYINDPRILFHSSHLFFLPSRIDSMPLVVLEAMSFGKNIVFYNSGGVTEATGDLGYYIDDFNVEKTVSVISELLVNISEGKMEIVNHKMKERYNTNFSKEKFVSGFISALKN